MSFLASRTAFYDHAEIAALQSKAYGAFNWVSVLRSQSCFEPGTCIRYRTDREKLMVDPTDNEIAALEHASPLAGEYLDALGITDLAQLTKEQWMQFLEVVVSAFQDKLADLASPIRPEEVPY